MSAFNQEFNKDNSIIRSILVAALSELNGKLSYDEINDQQHTKINVPFYFSLTGNERFIFDNFLNDCTNDPENKKAIGNYDVVPRGVVTLTSIEIDSGALVNKYVRMEIIKKVGNELKPFSYETFIIPLNISLDITVHASSHLEMFKLTEGIIRTFYKNNSFYVDLGMYRVQANLVIPESFEQEKAFEFTFSDKKTYDITFTLDLISYMPIFDKNTEMFAGNKVSGFATTVDDIRKAPISEIVGNRGYNILKETTAYYPFGPVYHQGNVDIDPEEEFKDPAAIVPQTTLDPGGTASIDPSTNM